MACVDDRAQPHRHALSAEEGFDRLKNILQQVVLLEQIPKAENRCLIRDLVADQIDFCTPAHGGHHNQRILHGWINEALLPLYQVNLQHGC